MRNRQRDRVAAYFEGLFVGRGAAYLSVFSEAELWRGLRPDEAERHEALLSRFIVLPVITPVARQAGHWMPQYGPHGLGWIDACIAATGKTVDALVLTRDRRLAALLSEVTAFEVY